MNLRVMVKALCSLIPVIVGTKLLVNDYLTSINHPEWSVSPVLMWMKFGISLIISTILLFVVFKQKKKAHQSAETGRKKKERQKDI